MDLTPFDLAQRFVGIKEIGGNQDHPVIQFGLMLCGFGTETPDETPWCSAWLQIPFWLLRLPRSKAAAARSWLSVGAHTALEEATVGDCVVILKRGAEPQPGAEVLNAPGHVGLFAGREGDYVHLLGGNQGNSVSVQRFPVSSVIGVRRIA